MATIITAHSGRYTLTIDDAQGAAPWDPVTLRMAGILPSFGESGRTRGAAILPCEFNFEVEDTPDRKLAGLFGDHVEDEFPVTIDGPPGPGGTAFKLRGYIKQAVPTEPLSRRVHPDNLSLTFYDGLTRLQSAGPNFQDNPSLTSITQALEVANPDLEAFIYTGCTHDAGVSGDDFTMVDAPKISFDKRVAASIRRWWDLLEQIGRRYQCRIYQDPYDRGSNALPRWHVMHRGAVGQEVTGAAFTSSGVTPSAETLTAEGITITRDSGALAVQGGRELKHAYMGLIREALPGNQDDDVPALVVNAKNALRDGDFEWVASDTTSPLYGQLFSDVAVNGSGGIVVGGGTGDGVWESIPFYAGKSSIKWARLSYGANTSSGGSDVSVTLEVEAGGMIVDSAMGGIGASQAIEVGPFSEGVVRLRVESDGGTFQNGVLSIYVNRQFSEEDEITEVIHPAAQSTLLEFDVEELIDMRLEATHDASSSPSPNAPCSQYIDEVTGLEGRTAGSYSAQLIQALHPRDTKTLSSELIGQVIGPRTRIIVEEQDGSVWREFVIGAGRTLDLKDEHTELSDISVPSFS